VTDDLRTQIRQIIIENVFATPDGADITEEQAAVANRTVDQINTAIVDAGLVTKSETITTGAEGETAQEFQDRAKQADESGNVPSAPEVPEA
jgi:hypothetical protein